MKSLFPFPLLFLFAGLSFSEEGEPVDFNRDIRPLLSDRCFHCHGPDEKKREADLRLDTREGAFAALDDEGEFFAIVPGNAEKSELIYRITTDDELDVMPPPESKLPAFTADEISLLKRWIDEGANYSELWTFVPVERPQIPESKESVEWASNEIDHFVHRKMEANQLEPSPEADRRTLIRRVSFEITGLPPKPEEVTAFLADSSEDAYEKVVDRLLASERYGERMAVEWLDAARYADTSGYQYDWFRTMWRWRDWVIDSYNRNQPYDEFITWQLAGDLLPDATMEQMIATGFNRNHPFTIEGGVIDEEYRVSYVADRVTTMGTVFMGLTLECARCHDHKFDPISQKDFYQLSAFFNHLPEKGQVGGKPLSGPPAIATPTREQAERQGVIASRLRELNQSLLRKEEKLDAAQLEWEKDRKSPWELVKEPAISSSAGTTFEPQDDGSLLAGGGVPRSDVYTFTVAPAAGKPVTGIKVEALTHKSMTGNGPGRSSNGNAVLTEIEIVSVDDSGTETVLPIKDAVADYEQKGFSAKDAIDGKKETGWAFDGNSNHADHWIAVSLADGAANFSENLIRVRLRFESRYAGHSFGRVRLSASTIPEPLTMNDEALQKLLSKAPADRKPAEQNQVRRAFRATLPQFQDTVKEIASLEKEEADLKAAIPMTMVMSDAMPRDTFILERGQYDKQLEKVVAAVPSRLPPLPEGAESNRLGLAQWLTQRKHPLTARVTMNRLWHQVFDVGIVKTVNDFGSQADWPSHQHLLDWLAVEFMDSGWDLKHMVKLIVMSSTYRQSSDTTEEILNRDPENRLLARGPRKRMSAEMVRDNALAVSGLLSSKIGGPSVKPYQPPGLWKELTNRKGFQQVYEADTGEDLYRRGLYTFWKRAAHHPMMATFDAPNREVCTFSRSATNTPLQALVLLHDPQFVEAARVLAVKLVKSSNRVESRIQQGYLTILSREASALELKMLSELYKAELSAFQANDKEAEKLLAVGEAPLENELNQAEAAAMTMVVRTIMNLSETITKH